MAKKPDYDEWVKTVKPGYADDENYNLRRAYELAPYEDLQKWAADPDNNHLNSAYLNPSTGEYEFVKKNTHSTHKKELEWYNSDDPEAVDFRGKYDYIQGADGWDKYIPKKSEQVPAAKPAAAPAAKPAAAPAKTEQPAAKTLSSGEQYAQDLTNAGLKASLSMQEAGLKQVDALQRQKLEMQGKMDQAVTDTINADSDREQSFTDLVLAERQRLQDEQDEMKRLNKQDVTRAKFAGLTEGLASLINLVGVAGAGSTHQQYQLRAADWMQRADEARERRKVRVDSMRDKLNALDQQLADLKAGNIKSRAQMELKNAEAMSGYDRAIAEVNAGTAKAAADINLKTSQAAAEGKFRSAEAEAARQERKEQMQAQEKQFWARLGIQQAQQERLAKAAAAKGDKIQSVPIVEGTKTTIINLPQSLFNNVIGGITPEELDLDPADKRALDAQLRNIKSPDDRAKAIFSYLNKSKVLQSRFRDAHSAYINGGSVDGSESTGQQTTQEYLDSLIGK